MPEGSSELRSALAASYRPILAVAIFSAFVNVLMPIGPLYMLQVYDQVLASGSEATLVALSVLVAFLFVVMGVLDYFHRSKLRSANGRQEGWKRLAGLLSNMPEARGRAALPRPRAALEVEDLSVGPPGEAVTLLRLVSVRLEPRHALAVIGPSGAGKSTLARTLTGVWRPIAGKVRLDGAALDRYDPDALGRLIAYSSPSQTVSVAHFVKREARMCTGYSDQMKKRFLFRLRCP